MASKVLKLIFPFNWRLKLARIFLPEVVLPPQQAKQAYGATSDVTQVLMHRSTYSDAELVTRVRALGKCHARTLYNFASDNVFSSMPSEMQEEVADLPHDFCDAEGNLIVK